MPPSGNFISGQKKRGSLSAGSDSRSLSLSLSESRSKNPLRAESARGPGLWATEESWEPREASRVCCGAGHQDDQLSTERQVARPEFTASQPLHVVMRVVREVGSLRRRELYKALRDVPGRR